MVTEKEKQFLLYWEQVRERESGFVRKLVSGLPMALMFGLPILLSVITVQLFFPEWSTKISKTSTGTYMIVFIAVLIAVFFYAFFRKHYKWEMNEQLYKELKEKQKRDNAITTTQ